MYKNRGKQQNGKDQRSLQENWKDQGNISCKDGYNNRNVNNVTRRKDQEELSRIPKRTIQKRCE